MKQLFLAILKKWGCAHEWDTYQTTKIYDYEYDKIPTRIKHTLICKKCGKIKQIYV